MISKLLVSPIGVLRLIASGRYLVYCNWEDPACERKLSDILKKLTYHSQQAHNSGESEILEIAFMQIKEYFCGERKAFNLPLLMQGTKFQENVWHYLSEIAYGEKRSYKEVSSKIGSPGSFRAVAGACGKNPFAIIIPCHRVVSSSGKLGGYTGGADKKEWLLSHEERYKK